MRKQLIAILLVFPALFGFGQKEDSILIKRLSDEILTNGKAYENLRYLTKQIGHRLAGSTGMVKSEQWGLNMMQESGASKAWMQECMVPHWVRGGADKATAFGSSKKSLDVVALGNSIGTGKKGIKADVVLVNSFDELEAKKDQVKGKIVFYNYKFNDTYVNTFSSYRDAGQYRGQGPSRASKYGAVAVIVRSLTHATDNFPHTGSTRYDSAYAKIPAVAIGLKDADWLAQQIKEGARMQVKITTLGSFLPDAIGHNIIGELTGSELPNEWFHPECLFSRSSGA